MIDDLAEASLHGQLRSTRQALACKLEGLSEYDVRRPLTATGSSLLGLVRHSATLEAWYFGEVFGHQSEEQIDTEAREAHWAKIERAAQEAAIGSHHADLSNMQCAVGTAL